MPNYSNLHQAKLCDESNRKCEDEAEIHTKFETDTNFQSIGQK